MSRSDRTFPVGPRLLALAVSIAAISLSVPMAGAQTGPSTGDVQNAHQAYLDAVAQIQQYQAQIAVVQARLARAVELLDQAQSELADIQRQIMALSVSDAPAGERPAAVAPANGPPRRP